METVCSLFPKLDDFRSDAVAPPSIGTGRIPFAVGPTRQLGHPPFEDSASSHHFALVTDNRT